MSHGTQPAPASMNATRSRGNRSRMPPQVNDAAANIVSSE